MSSLNKACLIGNLGRDPEVRSTQDGRKIVTLNIATSENWTDKNTGEKRERTEWHRVVIFNEKIAEIAERYLTKGASVYLEGALQTRKWTDQAGIEKYTTEIVLQQFRGELRMLSRGNGVGAGDRHGDEEQAAGGGYGRDPATPNRAPARGGDLDDEIPF